MDYSTLLGGVGLFLLGMILMSEGLKAASGPTLAHILEKGTNTRIKGFLSGFLATAILQSSTATTLITIGFVNAGVMTFLNSLWVIFGTNVGTTMTGWLVALIGLKLKIEIFALPIIGIGVFMRLLGEKGKIGKIGDILSGFGLLFLGIGFLQTGFSHIGTLFDFAGMSGHGLYSLLGFLLGGLVLTIIMQSSSAAIAVILTIASTTNIPLQEAASSVIGANIGTTLTAILAGIGATANAKRTVYAHVVFNIMTGIVALSILHWIVGFLDILRPLLGLDNSNSTSLALFHTVFNILGVLLMIPLAGYLARILEKFFRNDEAKIQVAQHLDKNLLGLPMLAIDALRKELERLSHETLSITTLRIRDLSEENRDDTPPKLHPLTELEHLIRDYSASLGRESKSLTSSKKLSGLVQVTDYLSLTISLIPEITLDRGGGYAKLPEKLQKELRDHWDSCIDILTELDPESRGPLFTELREEQYEKKYRTLKTHILKSESKGEMDVFLMDQILKNIHIIKGIILRSIRSQKILKSRR